MSALFRIPLGLLVIIIGFLIVWRTEMVFKWFGAVDFAEQKLGVGMSRFFYKLVGIGICFLGIFIATNIISDILESIANIFIR